MSVADLGIQPTRGVTAAQTDDDESSLAVAMAFVGRIAELRGADLVDVGKRIQAPKRAWAAHSAARQGLLSALWHRELTWAVWSVRDAMETAAFLARRTGQGLTAHERPSFELGCAAATETALGLLVTAHLPAADLDALYAPFEGLVPRASLVLPG